MPSHLPKVVEGEDKVLAKFLRFKEGNGKAARSAAASFEAYSHNRS